MRKLLLSLALAGAAAPLAAQSADPMPASYRQVQLAALKEQRRLLLSFADSMPEPFYRDKVDVFEDRMRGWLLAPALKLLDFNDFSVASVSLATNYFEGIEIYHSGLDSVGQSKAFFRPRPCEMP